MCNCKKCNKPIEISNMMFTIEELMFPTTEPVLCDDCHGDLCYETLITHFEQEESINTIESTEKKEEELVDWILEEVKDESNRTSKRNR